MIRKIVKGAKVVRAKLSTRCNECGAVIENGHWGWCSQA